MGIAYPKSDGILGRPTYGSGFSVLSDLELRDWGKQVRQLLRKNPFGLVNMIFGAAVASRFVDQGHFPDIRPPPRRVTSTSSSASSSSSSSAGQRRLRDDDEVEDLSDLLREQKRRRMV